MRAINCICALLLMAASTVSVTATQINVSGGGAALQTAITSAVTGDVITVTDSLDYSPVTIADKAITIQSAPGQRPRVVGNANTSKIVWFDYRWQGCVWRGIDIVQPAARAGFGVALQASWGGWLEHADSSLTIEDALIKIDVPGSNLDGPVIAIEGPAILRNVRAFRNDTNNNPIIRFTDYSGKSQVIDCEFGDGTQVGACLWNTTQLMEFPNQSPPVVPEFQVVSSTLRPSPTSQAFLNWDYPHRWNIRGGLIQAAPAAGLGLMSNSGTSSFSDVKFDGTTLKLKNRLALNLTSIEGTTFTFRNCVWMGDTRTTGSIALGANPVSLTFQHCTFTTDSLTTTGQRGLVFFNVANNAPASVEFRNSIFNYPGQPFTAIARVPAATVAPTVISGKNMFNIASFAPGDLLNGVGTDLLNNPLMQADGIHLSPDSPAIDAGDDIGVLSDIDGHARPFPSGGNPDLGADEYYVQLNRAGNWAAYN